MTKSELDETRHSWNMLADDWRIQVGDEGDLNRILNSDPVLWEFVGDVKGRHALDAGCGTGYLTNKLHQKGALVRGIDISNRMIDIARNQYPSLSFAVDSCTELVTVADQSCDLIVSNYVLMDTPYLDAAVQSFSRVLRPGGIAVLVFSHPCFPQTNVDELGGIIHYSWNFPYFEESKQVDPPWRHFKSDFTWYHRPLSGYWKTFKSAGFQVEDFDEPRVTEDRYHLTNDKKRLHNSQMRPYSVAFKLVKA